MNDPKQPADATPDAGDLADDGFWEVDDGSRWEEDDGPVWEGPDPVDEED